MQFETIEDVLTFAVAEESRAAELYAALAERALDPELRRVLKALSREEEAHRTKLEQFSAGDLSLLAHVITDDTAASETALAGEPGPDASLGQVLLHAIACEHEAFQLYMWAAAQSPDPGLATILRAMAAEEAEHRVHLERLYDRCILDLEA